MEKDEDGLAGWYRPDADPWQDMQDLADRLRREPEAFVEWPVVGGRAWHVPITDQWRNPVGGASGGAGD